MAASKGEQAMNLHLQEIESLSNSLREREKYVTELENRLRALWDKLEGERKFYDQRIRELEIAGNAMYAFINPPSPSMRTIRMDNLLQGWDDAKIGKEAKP
jgi:DNA repair exonuclease SbcCD ATPase subunit